MITALKKTKVLVTGANGFIGSHLIRRLIFLGAKVSVFIEPDTSLWRIKDIAGQIDIHYLDIRDFKKVKLSLEKIKPSKVYHLAACIDVCRSWELVPRMIEVNLGGTINLLRALEEGLAVDSFVNTGTCEEYGDNQTPFLENQRENPVSPYSSSKVCATYFCQMLHKTKKMPIVTLRPFLTYGPYQTNNMLIPSLIRKCILNEDFAMTKGEQGREFNYVSDIVEGYIKASLTEGAFGQIINLGNGQEYKIKEVVNLIVKLTKTKMTPQVGKLPYRKAEARHFYCSNEKAKKLLGWRPKISLEQGIFRTVQWYKDYLKNDKRESEKSTSRNL